MPNLARVDRLEKQLHIRRPPPGWSTAASQRTAAQGGARVVATAEMERRDGVPPTPAAEVLAQSLRVGFAGDMQ